MAEGEDVPAAAGLADAVIDARLDRLWCAEQQTGINISLHADVLGEPCTGFRHVHSPVEGDDVHTGLGHSLDHAGTAGDIEDERGVGMGLLDQVDHLLLIGSCKNVIVGRAQLAGPGIEHLHHLGAGIDLIAQVTGN